MQDLNLHVEIFGTLCTCHFRVRISIFLNTSCITQRPASNQFRQPFVLLPQHGASLPISLVDIFYLFCIFFSVIVYIAIRKRSFYISHSFAVNKLTVHTTPTIQKKSGSTLLLSYQEYAEQTEIHKQAAASISFNTRQQL